MAERPTAEGRLRRLLYVLPAARGEGASLSDLARRLDCSPSDILEDLEEVTDREFYLPAGAAEDIQISISGDRVRVWTKGEFDRPPSLTEREAVALGLGLRALAAEGRPADRAVLVAAAARLETAIVGRESSLPADYFAVSAGLGATGGMRAVLQAAARSSRACEIEYLRPGLIVAETRQVEPFALAYAGNVWYLIGHCLRAEAVRVFRLDRMLGVRVLDRTFERPASFDPDDYVSGGNVFRTDHDAEVVVRYEADVARWVRERETAEEAGDGAVLVRHRVADPGWLVRHVLRFGGSASVVAPDSARELVHTAARAMLDMEGI